LSVPQFAPLLSQLHLLIESSYDWATGIQDVGRFVVGDEGYRRLYGHREVLGALPESPLGARTLVAWEGDEVRIRVYYPDRLVRHLEIWNPTRGIDEENVGHFSVLIEELDHLLMLAWCARHRRPVRLLELEFHANITKYLVLVHFLGRLGQSTRLHPGMKQWVRLHVFQGAGEDLPPPFRKRYETAARLAARFLHLLDRLPVAERIRTLRRFARQSWQAQRRILDSPEEDPGLGLAVVL
jgi:hypothetical protein